MSKARPAAADDLTGHDASAAAAAENPQPTDPDRLLAALAAAVLAIPGVARLEPTLSTSGPTVLIHRRPTDGIRVLTRFGTAEIDVNIATTTNHQARTITHNIQTKIADLLPVHGYRTGSITVNVLTIEPALPPKLSRGKFRTESISARKASLN